MPNSNKQANNKDTREKSIFKPFKLRTEKGMGLPEFQDLCDKVRFVPTEGHVLLGGSRLLIANLSCFAVMRRELIEQLGLEKARGIFTRMGYSAGYQDADEVGTQLRAEGDAYDVLTAGPALHAIMGWASVEPIKLEIDVAAGHYYGEFLWRDSAEANFHLKHHSISMDPVCWTQIGYAAGYGSRFMGKRILYKEISCRAMGDSHCKIIGKPIDQWDDPSPEINYMYPDINHHVANTAPAYRAPRIPTPEGRQPSELTSFGGMVGVSSGFTNTCHLLQRVAKTNATVLLLGETGVGKEQFARVLHATSNCSDGPFITINCAAIPSELIEAELFGVVKGAFSGATNSRAGRFERADGGSIFLDEVGTLNLAAQAKLLRVLQEREFERVGDEQVRKINTRIIAATNANLKEDVENGDFRDDLWYRLNVYPIEIPPLRERRDDIPLLLEYFLNTFNELHQRTVKGYTERAIEALLYYSYPGNIRELEHMVERAVILADNGSALDIQQLFDQSQRNTLSPPFSMSSKGKLHTQSDWQPESNDQLGKLVDHFFSEKASMDDLESAFVLRAVEQTDGNLAEAARLLGMTRRQLDYRYNKLK